MGKDIPTVVGSEEMQLSRLKKATWNDELSRSVWQETPPVEGCDDGLHLVKCDCGGLPPLFIGV